MGEKSHYWTDEAYAEFYRISNEEKQIMNGQLESAPTWGPDAEANKSHQFGDAPSNDQILKFQQVFAEYSSGRDWVRAVSVRKLFSEVGVALSAAQVREILHEIAPGETSPKPHYCELLHIFCKCIGLSVGNLERVKPAKRMQTNSEKEGEKDVTDVLLVDEAREYCVAAGVPEAQLEELLRTHTSDGLVSLIGLDKDLKKMEAAGCLSPPPFTSTDLGAELGAGNLIGEPSPGVTGSAKEACQSSAPKAHAVASKDVATRACDLEAATLPASGEANEVMVPTASQAADVEEEDDLADLKKQLEEARAALAAKQETHKNEIDRYKAELQKFRSYGDVAPEAQ